MCRELKIRGKPKAKKRKRPLEVEREEKKKALLFFFLSPFQSRGTGSLLLHAGLTDTGYFLFQTQRAGATCFGFLVVGSGGGVREMIMKQSSS